MPVQEAFTKRVRAPANPNPPPGTASARGRARSLAGRVWVARRWDMGGYTARGRPDREGVELVMEVELPTITHFRHYFPDATIRFERFAGIVKSLIAVRSPAKAPRFQRDHSRR